MQEADNTNTTGLTFTAPSLPKGGGALTGLSGAVGVAGPDGSASLSVPLPITQGRGYSPALALQYNSQAGNGPFGMGWSVNTPAIRRHLRKGVPLYNQDDGFLGPDGEQLAPVPDAQGGGGDCHTGYPAGHTAGQKLSRQCLAQSGGK